MNDDVLVRKMAALILGLLDSPKGPPKDASFWATAQAVLDEIKARGLDKPQRS